AASRRGARSPRWPSRTGFPCAVTSSRRSRCTCSAPFRTGTWSSTCHGRPASSGRCRGWSRASWWRRRPPVSVSSSPARRSVAIGRAREPPIVLSRTFSDPGASSCDRDAPRQLRPTTCRPGRLPMIVDVHAHYFPKAYNELLVRIGGRSLPESARALTARPMREDDASGIPTRLEQMDDAGVQLQVLSPAASPPYAEKEADAVHAAQLINDSYAELAAKHPGKLAAFVS